MTEKKQYQMFSKLFSTFSKIEKKYRFAFFCSIVIGLIAHLYKFVNYLPNHDALYALYADQDVTGSGRWFLEYPALISSNFDLPLVIGILSIVYLSLTVVFLIKLFNVQNYGVIILISGVVVAYPSVTAIFFYGYTADAYMFALLIATVSVYLSRFDENRIVMLILSGLLLCLSCACYQAFVPYALVLVIVYFVFHVLEGDVSVKQCWQYVLKQIIIILSSMTVYYISWKLLLKIKGTEATSYLGISDMKFSIAMVLDGIKRSVHELMYFICESNLSRSHLSYYCFANCLAILAFVLILFVAIIRSKIYKNYVRIVFVVGALIVSFPCIIIWNLVSSDTVSTARVLMSTCLFLVFTILLCDRWISIKLKDIFGVFVVTIIFNYIIMSNVGYFTLNRSWQNSIYKASEMMCDIHDFESQYDVDSIAFVGEGSYDYPIVNSKSLRTTDRTNFYSKYELLSFYGDLLFDNVHAYLYLVNYCGLDLSYVDDDELLSLQELPEVEKLNVWPADNSIVAVDNVLVIKLSEDLDYWWLAE